MSGPAAGDRAAPAGVPAAGDRAVPAGVPAAAGSSLLAPAVVLAVVRRPWLWRTAMVQVKRLAMPGWWRRWPPLPAPAPAWLAFRLETQYGSATATPEPADVVAWLEWCREWARAGLR